MDSALTPPPKVWENSRVETFCYHCGRPVARKRHCAHCQRRRAVDYSRMLAGEISPAELDALRGEASSIYGAVNVEGYVFWWKGVPHLSAAGVASIKRL